MYWKKEDSDGYDKRVEEWNNIEDLIIDYKKQFDKDGSTSESKDAAQEILKKFEPLIKKYFNLIKFGEVKWSDMDTRYFLAMFVDSSGLKKMCRRHGQSSADKQAIMANFNFARESFSSTEDEELMNELNIRMLTLARRYKQVGRNFCGYVYGCYKYEIYRFIKSRLANPLNIGYKIVSWNETHNDEICDKYYNEVFIDEEVDTPSSSWISGETCSQIFKGIRPVDRQILIKYYLEEWKDKQIADEFGMHINTVNQRRRNAAKIIANECGIDISSIKRTRKSGKKAILPNE